ncbi:MAG: alpha/beta hydrolase-fold protein [Phycisphaerales bacterium]|nr:alpha/beta hydrolase-fold protein [Phycisphaerales bacterium]
MINPLILSTLTVLLLPAVTHGSTVEYIDNGRGLVPVYLPSDYDGTQPLPLIVALHGYTQTGPEIEAYYNLSNQVDEKQFLLCVPQGNRDFTDEPFWNATDACCDIFNTNVDDSGYLRQIVELVQAQYAVDDLSIHFTGLSNGGFMSYRMACDHADLIASIVPLAGVTFLDTSDCTPSEQVHVLHLHGTADSTIEYDGGCFFFQCYPGAEESVLNWVDYNQCDVISEDGGPAFNLDWSVGGNETTSTIYRQNCTEGVTVELWTMNGSEHVPNFRRNSDPLNQNLFATRAVDWMLNHRKPGPVPCPSDINGDQTVDINDILGMLAAWNTSDSSADIDGDGTVDVVDMLILLDDFGQDCE